MEDMLRPGIEGWASTRTRMLVCEELGRAGVAAAPCLRAGEVVQDPHLAARDMLVEVPRTDGVAQPVLVPGNPVRMSDVAIGPDTRAPWLGEHTDAVLAGELGLSDGELGELRAAGVIG
jgi:formyl-CoA transferase